MPLSWTYGDVAWAAGGGGSGPITQVRSFERAVAELGKKFEKRVGPGEALRPVGGEAAGGGRIRREAAEEFAELGQQPTTHHLHDTSTLLLLCPMQQRYIGPTAPHTAFSCGEQVPDVAIPHYKDARMQHSQSR